MDSYLASGAWKELFGNVGLPGEENAPHSIKLLALSELLEEERCRAYVEWFMTYIGAPDACVAASMLVKRIASLLVAPVLGAMTCHNKGIVAELEHCRLFHLDAATTGTAFPFMALSDSGVKVTAPTAGGRASWREEVVRQLFAERLTPLMRTIAAVGSVSMTIMWENVMARIVPVYDCNEKEERELRRRAADDFRYMAKDAGGELFGMRRNPLASFTETDANLRLAGRRKRLTCCLYYQMAPAEYCVKCPKQ